jgi:pyrroline-5-carboxylate reductase
MERPSKAVAIIGLGSMGGMLARGFLRSGRLAPESLWLSTRTRERAGDILSRWPTVTMAPSNAEAASGAGAVFLCVEPKGALGVLAEIAPALSPQCHLVSIVGSIGLGAIESIIPCPASIAVPSLASEADRGVTLICHGSRILPERGAEIERLFSGIGPVKALPEALLGPAADLASCGPGLLAVMLGEFLKSRAPSGLPPEDADWIWRRTVLGTAAFLTESGIGYEEAYARVATKGGITEAGAGVLREGLPGLFARTFESMAERRAKRSAELGPKG